MSAITADRVTRRFGRVVAVDDVSVRIRPGEVVGLVGANGAGKTTLLRMLLGLLAPTAGDVTLVGRPPSRLVRRRVGYVPQGLGLWHDLTVAEHLRFAAAAYGVPTRPFADAALQRCADRLVGDLPFGLRRRAAFALAAGHRPDALLLDEPTAGVDPLARADLWELIGRAAADGAAVLVSTHYLDEASRCDRVILLVQGRVAASGDVAALTRGRTAVRVDADRWDQAWTVLEAAGLAVLPAGRALRVTGATAAQVSALVADLGAQVTEVPATLEEVFLAVSA